VELAIRRIGLLYGVALTAGGIPLIYFGDEIGVLNDYGFRDDPDKAGDSRWAHRPVTDWQKMERRKDPTAIEGRIYQHLQRLIAVRKTHAAFAGSELQAMETGNPHVLGYIRTHNAQRALVLANFSENAQTLPANLLRLYGLNYRFRDLVSGAELPAGDVILEGCQFLCLEAA
jgi:glycosidase